MKILLSKIDYITPSRTIETISDNKKTVFIYNYKGIHYRFFKSKAEFNRFLNKGIEPEYDFDSEQELDLFISQF